MKKFFNQNCAFTLAEVLITLGIIGIVAEITIPTLMNNIQNVQFKTSWKKTYSVFSNATILIKSDNVGNMAGLFTDGLSMITIYSKYLSIVKTCDTDSVAQGCIASQHYKGLDGTGDGGTDAFNRPGIILKDGTSVVFFAYDSASAAACSHTPTGVSYPMTEICGTIYVDINGLNKPNIVGKDLFVISLTKSGVYANGSKGSGLGIDDWTQSCNPTNTTYAWRGQGCSAKYLFE